MGLQFSYVADEQGNWLRKARKLGRLTSHAHDQPRFSLILEAEAELKQQFQRANEEGVRQILQHLRR